MIAISEKPHTIAEMLLSAVILEFCNLMLGIDVASKIKFIPMSNNSIKMRIDEMSDNVLNQLCSELRNEEFSLQLDETTLSTNGAFLMAYVRYINNNEIREEFLFGEELRLDTKGLSIFECVKTFFNKANIPITNIIACATAGIPHMCGRYQGFKAYLKQKLKICFQFTVLYIGNTWLLNT